MNYTWRDLHFTVLSSLILTLLGCSRNPGPQPFFTQDLHPFGFFTDSGDRIVGNFTDLNFLSNDLVLVTVNTRVYGPVERSESDQPLSKLILFDVSRRSVIRAKVWPVEKSSGSVRATQNGQFALLNESGLQICSTELECGLPVPTRGPMFVSPEGTRIVIGGNSRTEQKLLDGGSLKELERFPLMNPSVIPGENGLLTRYGSAIYVTRTGKPDAPVTFEGVGAWPEVHFLDRSTIAGFESDKELAVAKIDGTIQFHVPVTARWHLSEISTSASGSRFCFHEAGYTTFNSVVNFLDVDGGRPANIETVKVISIKSGKSILELRWDPRPYVGTPSTPALSPDGNRLALVRHGILEIYEIH